MSEYKLYWLDRNGRIARRVDLEAGDDASALEVVRTMEANADRELWCGARKVAFLPLAS